MKEYTLCYQNVRGLRTKSTEINVAFVGSNYEVIALSKTSLTLIFPSSLRDTLYIEV